MTNPRLALAPDRSNVAVARAFVAAGLATLEVGDAACQKAKLVTSELVTLLVETQRASEIAVWLMTDERSVRVEAGVGLPPIPSDVGHIIDALEGITVGIDDHTWIITFREDGRGT